MWPNSSRCAICSSKNKPNNKTICEECIFIKEFVIKFGRENLRQIVSANSSPHLSRRATVSEQTPANPSTTNITNNNTCTPNPACIPIPGNTCNVPSCSCHARAAAQVAQGWG